MPLNEAPSFNLKAVINETGLAADTLRAWERRYGVPKPQRTPGGHRLYSERDIRLIKWLMARQAEGLSISRAVDRWNNLTAEGEDPLEDARPTFAFPAEADTRLNALRQQWLAACLAFDEPEAEQVLNQAFALFPVETVVADIIVRDLREVGDRWQRREATVQQEHFMSALATRRMQALVGASGLGSRARMVLIGCPPGELHSLPMLYLNMLLRRRGRSTIYLGADVPIEHLEETARVTRSALVVLSAQRLSTAVQLRAAAGDLTRRGAAVAYGGRVFNQLPELRRQIAGTFLGEAIEGCGELIDAILARGPELKPATERPSAVLSGRFAEARPRIEAAVQQRLGADRSLNADLAIANSYFGAALAAALELGSIAFLATDMSWIDFLLTKPHLPFRSPRDYLLAYAAAVREMLGDEARNVSEWLEARAAQD